MEEIVHGRDQAEGHWAKAGVIAAILGTIFPIVVYFGLLKAEFVSGHYRGGVENLTVGGAADLDLIINVDGNGALRGRLTLEGSSLYGSGDLEGRVEGSKVSFTSFDPSTHIQVTWAGMADGNRLEGSYVASHPPHLQPMFGVQQVGRWWGERR